MTRWEYHVCRFTPLASWDVIENELGHLGLQGWELVTILDGRSYVFKRPRPRLDEKAIAAE